jgi:DNA (cytosine-5)-methyltransferase 1
MQTTALPLKSPAPKKVPLTALDFFAGSGLVSYSLKSCFKTIWANDNSEKKGLVYTNNHNKRHFVLAGIETITGQAVPYADLSWASFPCQDLSLAGIHE